MSDLTLQWCEPALTGSPQLTCTSLLNAVSSEVLLVSKVSPQKSEMPQIGSQLLNTEKHTSTWEPFLSTLLSLLQYRQPGDISLSVRNHCGYDKLYILPNQQVLPSTVGLYENSIVDLQSQIGHILFIQRKQLRTWCLKAMRSQERETNISIKNEKELS